MAEEQELLQLEVLCKQLYETTDAALRSEAEKALVQFAAAPNCLNKCQMLLERGSSPYAQLLAATTLTKLISRSTMNLPLEQRLDMRNYVMNYVVNRPKLQNYVSQALVQLLAKITKEGWFDTEKDDFVFRTITNDVRKIFSSSLTHHVMVGVQLLSQVVVEMNQMEASRSQGRHRKVVASFRDSQLFDIFEIGCGLLRKASDAVKSIDFNDADQHGLLNHTLRLVHNCLTFDFVGNATTDESTDDLPTVQMPTTWRSAFLDGTTLKLFFELYTILPPTLSPMALSCLVQIAAVRRSLFHNTERAVFLNQLVAGVKLILENPQTLSEPNNYHEFCRLLARLKANYQLGELVKVDNYTQVIKLIAEFTVTSIQMWQFAPNSVHYLLALWKRMIQSVPYVKASEPHLLETYTPEVTKAYITSRLDSVAIVLSDGVEDPLDDQAMVSQQLDQLSTIGRCEYEKTCALLVQLFDESAQSYQQLTSSPQSNTNDMQIAIQEGRLTWLVNIIGAVIGGRQSYISTDDHDAMDGELVCRILQLMNLTDSHLSQRGCEKLDLSVLHFFEQFRKTYLGDQVQKTSKAYRRLHDVLGLGEESLVLSVIIGKIITNLKYWGGSKTIISKTLQLLSDLSVGHSSLRKLVGLEAIQFMLNNHTSEHFPFLTINNTTSQLNDFRSRTTFYTSLGRLLLFELGEDVEKFERFMLPLTNSFEALGTLFAQVNTPMFRTDEAKRYLVGLARDLRGLTFAFNTKGSYLMLFDWVYPTYIPIFIRAVELWYHDSAVTTPVLKFMAEFSQNRSQRLQFDVSSPNGILIIRVVSKVIIAYGTQILTLGDIPKDQQYSLKLKGISICFAMLKAALSGNYVNFGTFTLYGDDALDNALRTFVKLLLSVSQNDLMGYPKLSQNYYALVECLAQDHMQFMAQIEPTVLVYILSTISEGLSAIDTMVSTGCSNTLDNMISFIYRKLIKQPNKVDPANNTDAFMGILKVRPDILQQMLATVFNIIFFEDCRNQWSMSRPLLPLILVNEDYFSKFRETVISSQAAEKQATMAQCFDTLMNGIDRTLITKNRDGLTTNVAAAKRDWTESLKTTTNSTTSSNSNAQNDMMSQF